MINLQKSVYDLDQWEKDGTFKAAPNQAVSQGVINYFAGCVPPTTMTSNVFQVGEPYDCDRQGRFTYATFEKENGQWIFKGYKTNYKLQ